MKNLQTQLSRGTVTEIAQLWRTRGHEFDTVHLATALHRYARGKQKDEVLSQLTSALTTCLRQNTPRGRHAKDDASSTSTSTSLWSPRTLASTASSFAAARASNEAFEALSHRMLASSSSSSSSSYHNPLSRFTPMELATTSYACALKRYKDTHLLEALGAETVRKLPDFDERALSNVLWSFTKLEHASLAMDIIRRRSTWNLLAFQHDEMAMTLWSIGTWVKVDPSLRRPEWDHDFPLAVEAKMKYFNAEALTNVVKAMVNLSYTHTLPTLLQSAEEKVHEFQGAQLAQLSWTVAKFNLPVRWFQVLPLDVRRYDERAASLVIWAWATANPPFHGTEKIMELATPALATNGSHAAMTCWGLATLGIGAELPFFQALHDAVTQKRIEFKPEELCNVIFSLATLQIQPHTMRTLLMQARLIDSDDARHWTTLAWAMGEARVADEELVETILAKMSELPLKDSTITITLYALSLLRVRVSSELADHMLGQLSNDDWDRRSTWGGRLASAIACLKINSPTSNRVLHRIFTSTYPDDTAMQGNALAGRAYAGLLRRNKMPVELPWFYVSPPSMIEQSAFHKRLFLWLTPHYGDTLKCENAISPDITVDLTLELADGRKIAIEIDGPKHFIQYSTSKAYDGPTAWTSEQIELMGWILIRMRTEDLKSIRSGQEFISYFNKRLNEK